MGTRTEAELVRIFQPMLAAAARQASVADRFVDKDLYRLHVATLWANVVMDPAAAGIDETDLEAAHDVINLGAKRVLGDAEAITAAYRFIETRAGEQALDRLKVPRRHRQLLLYFRSMILDPEGHRQRMAAARRPRSGR